MSGTKIFRSTCECDARNERITQVLHWSNFPCEDELQITFKFIFPFACLLDEELQAIVRNAVEAYSWQYNYQWSHGVLLKYDSVRIGVTQHGDNILEISGRIDIADLEDYSNGSPMRYVWPYLSLVVDIALKFFDKFSMPFQSTDMESNEHGANSIDAFVDRFLDETLDEVLTR
uniref:Uncharacterized protein n=1 Tax=Parascaris univalens TaxID=6257 RepID=A0A915B648_PARUN